MKKKMSAMLALTIALSMAACGGSAQGTSTTEAPAETAASEAAETTAEAAEETQEATTNGDSVVAVDLGEYLMANTEYIDPQPNAFTGGIDPAARNLPIDRTEVNEHALNGYFSYTLDSGRTVKMYFGEHAALRAYIYVIAVPNNTEDVYAYLDEQGWIEQADRNGEILFVLEPENGTWGTSAEEAEYLSDCLRESVSNTAFGARKTDSGGLVTSGRFKNSDDTTTAVFTGHATNYYIGYGEGCAVLESWTSNNPSLVISQAFIGGESAGQEVLDASASRSYHGINTGGYYAGTGDQEFSELLTKLKNEGVTTNDSYVTNADIAVPTMFAGYAADDASIDYWKGVNDVSETADGDSFYQSLDSDAWQTLYANKLAENWGSDHGISQVKVVENADMNAEEIRGFLSMYTRYTTPFVYSNNIAYRLNYYPLTHDAREAAMAATALETFTYTNLHDEEAAVELRAVASDAVTVPGVEGIPEGTMYSVISAFADYDEDGTMDPREVLIYVPEKAKEFTENGAPAVVIFPGSTQAAATFMDASGWWQVAADEGCVLMIMGQYCRTSASSLTYGADDDNSNFMRSNLEILKSYVAEQSGITIDESRIYASGHSLGSLNIQTLTHTTENAYIAAVGSTSFPNTDFTGTYMPSFLAVGQADISEPLPDPRSRDLVKHPWNQAADSAIYNWVKGCMEMNGLDFTFTDGDHEEFLATCADYTETGRYYTYTWNSDEDVPAVSFVRTMAREHNSYPEEFRLAWDFMKHYSVNEDGTRSYSESAFEADDLVTIWSE